MLRGIYDGGGVRKQNGHWQSGTGGVIPPIPPIASGSFLIRSAAALSGEIVKYMYDASGRPYFKPVINPESGKHWDISIWDANLNTGGNEVNSDYNADGKYVNALVHYLQFYDENFNDLSNYSKLRFVFTPTHANDTDLGQYERALAIPFRTNYTSIYRNIENSDMVLCNDSYTIGNTTQSVHGTINKQAVQLNLKEYMVRLDADPSANPDYMYGFPIGENLTIEVDNATIGYNWVYLGLFHTFFSFVYDFIPTNQINDNLSLDFKIIGVA